MQIAKRVSDPVHGSIPLTPVEVAVMDTQVFQRLRRVKQLGLAHFVFPSADYSRLAHSLGVCHVTGLTIQALKNSGVNISDQDEQTYRLAGLLHDVGHYPLSHCTEHALQSYYEVKKLALQLKPKLDGEVSIADEQLTDDLESYKHEAVSRLLVSSDEELVGVLRGFDIDPEDVASIFTHAGKFPFDSLVSSDLDADRIDYLLRSARATGLPYGSVDIQYLLSQICLDDSGRVCIHPKGIRAAEHFLLCRYFDYQQVVFHKSVVGFEQVAQQVIKVLLEQGRINWSKTTMRSAVGNNTWLDWDDDYLMSLISDVVNDESMDEIIRLKARHLTHRISPKLVIDLEMIDDASEKNPLSSHGKLVTNDFYAHAAEFGISREQCFTWSKTVKLTSIGTAVPRADIEDFDEEKMKSIYVLKARSGKKDSEPLSERKSSVMSVLGDKRLFMYRLYVVPKDREQRAALTALSAKLMEEHDELPWK